MSFDQFQRALNKFEKKTLEFEESLGKFQILELALRSLERSSDRPKKLKGTLRGIEKIL